MTLSRAARIGLLLLLLAVTAGVYLQRNLDAILDGQARRTLLAYGVDDYHLDGPRFGSGSFSARALWLRGDYDGYAYDITLDAPDVRYDWRSLLTRRVHAINLSGLTITIDRTGPVPTQEHEPVVITTGRLLPAVLFAALPAQALDINDLQITYRAPAMPDLLVTGTVRYRERLEATLHTALAAGELALDVTSGTDPSTLNALVTLREAGMPAAELAALLRPVERDEWEWHITGEWRFAPLLAWLGRLAVATDRAPTLPGNLVLAGRGEIEARIRHPDNLQLQPGRGLQALSSLTASAHTVVTLEQLDYPGLVSGLAGTIDTSTTLADGRLELRLAPGQLAAALAVDRLGIPEETREVLQWGETVPALWHNREPLLLSFEGNRWTGRLRDTSVQLGNSQTLLDFDMRELDTALAPGEDEPTTLDANLAAGIDIRLRQQPLPRLQLDLAHRGTVEQGSVELKLAGANDTLDVALAGNLNLVSGQSRLDLKTRSGNLQGLFIAALPALGEFGILSADMAIDSGSLELDTHLASAGYDPAQWSQTSTLALSGLSGGYDGYRFEGLALTADWRGIREWQTLRPLALSLDRLDVGVAITNLTVRATLPRPTPITSPAVSLEAFSAKLFGGEVFLPQPGTWDFGAASNSLTLRAQGWQLAQIVAVQQNEDIRAQGVLEGELPVAVTDGRVIIERGYLRAVPPGGTIQYLADDASRTFGANSRELALALELLRDFRYEVLSSTVELDPAGNLKLGLSLTGHNPGQFEGRKVNFNINLDQNLGPLLQSLRMSGKLTDQIESRLR